jgi:hypothetical protein
MNLVVETPVQNTKPTVDTQPCEFEHFILELDDGTFLYDSRKRAHSITHNPDSDFVF